VFSICCLQILTGKVRFCFTVRRVVTLLLSCVQVTDVVLAVCRMVKSLNGCSRDYSVTFNLSSRVYRAFFGFTGCRLR